LSYICLALSTEVDMWFRKYNELKEETEDIKT